MKFSGNDKDCPDCGKCKRVDENKYDVSLHFVDMLNAKAKEMREKKKQKEEDGKQIS